jgi:hypothetical protein
LVGYLILKDVITDDWSGVVPSRENHGLPSRPVSIVQCHHRLSVCSLAYGKDSDHDPLMLFSWAAAKHVSGALMEKFGWIGRLKSRVHVT